MITNIVPAIGEAVFTIPWQACLQLPRDSSSLLCRDGNDATWLVGVVVFFQSMVILLQMISGVMLLQSVKEVEKFLESKGAEKTKNAKNIRTYKISFTGYLVADLVSAFSFLLYALWN